MSNKRIGLPQGTTDTLFDRYIKKQELQTSLLGVFNDRGYRTIATPTFEYADVFDLAGDYSDESAYRFSDDEGRMMALRCDSSTPIARMVSSCFKNSSFPLRISYNQSVYKRQASYGGKRHEMSQSGVELIGATDEFDANLEIVRLSIEALKSSGLKNFKVELGHAALFDIVVGKLPLDKGECERLHRYMETKNVAALFELLKNFDDENKKICELLCAMPGLFGDKDEMLKAKKLFADIKEANQILSTLEHLYNRLCDEGYGEYISFDFGLVQQFDYYTGIIFSAYSAGFGEALLSGGRYDRLYGRFGEERSAIGFVVNVDSIIDIKQNEKNIDRPLRLALTKGRLQKNACKLMEAAGLDMGEVGSDTRKLIIPIQNGRYELVLAKAADVITYVTHGVCDIGLVGKDTMREQGGSYYELLDTGFGRCRFAVAAPNGFSYEEIDGTLTIATKYPKVAKTFFEGKGLNVEIIKIDGSVELAPLLGLADAIVDIVETGETLRANGLTVVEDITDISARIISNIASMKLRKDEIEELISMLRNEQ